MKTKMIFLIFAAFTVGFAVFILADSRRGELKVGDSGAPLATIEPRSSFPQPVETAEYIEIAVPIIFEFILESDYVVIANLRDTEGLVRRDGPQPGSKGFDHKYWSGYVIYSMNVQSFLFSKEMLESGKTRTSPTSIDVLEPPMRGLEGGFLRNRRYLLFIQKVPENEDVFRTLTIDNKKTYHRVVIGNRSLFYDGKPSIHSGPKRGSIYLERVLDADLIPAITQLCAALSLSDTKARIERLRELSKSENQKLRTNAEYAIQYLNKIENSRRAK